MSFTHWAQVQYIKHYTTLPTLPGEGSITILNTTWRGVRYTTILIKSSPIGRTLSKESHYASRYYGYERPSINGGLWGVTTIGNKNPSNLL